MRSPVLTSRGIRFPSSLFFPLPAAMILPCWGFSFAELGMMIPPIFFSPSSRRWTMIRSCSGLTFMLCPPSVVMMGGGSFRTTWTSWHSPLATANYTYPVGSVKTGVLGALLDLVSSHLSRQGVAVDAEGVGGLRQG